MVDRCPRCDRPVATGDAWRHVDCTPIDWRGRALAAEERRDRLLAEDEGETAYNDPDERKRGVAACPYPVESQLWHEWIGAWSWAKESHEDQTRDLEARDSARAWARRWKALARVFRDVHAWSPSTERAALAGSLTARERREEVTTLRAVAEAAEAFGAAPMFDHNDTPAWIALRAALDAWRGQR